MLLMFKVTVPGLVSVTVCGELVDKRFCAAKVKAVGEIEAVGPLVVPVPLSETVCGLPAALSATEIAAVRAPAAVGVKTALMVQ
jgi:hypothetical protein